MSADALNPRQFKRLFHGTRTENVSGIEKEGLRPPSGTGPGWFMLTSSRRQAASYTPDSESSVVEFRVPKERIYGTAEHRRSSGDAVLWPAQEHNVYGVSATAHAVRGAVPPEYIAGIHPVKKRAK